MGVLDRFKKGKNNLEELEEKQKDVKASEVESAKTIEQVEAPKKKASKKAPAKKVDTGSANSGASNNAFAGGVLLQPFVSEKAAMNEQHGTYTFVVSATATKVDIKRAVKEMYGVKPAHVRVMNQEGKHVRFGRVRGRRSDWKKAYVTLPKGQTISIHEGV